ncbi:hypothetical protein DYB25_001744 [Aphanomyces astaci]|uniref:GRF-type domain-containing protein n=1 Tax=Aphanomyces astaci TaxID=112090 RepID=A0A397BKB1_APHAT|nr:hypothetical protein DYB25_001744 [Aphanomyces astaci]
MVVSCNLIGSILLPILVKSHDDPSTLFLSCPRCMKSYGLPMHSSVVAMANTFCPLCHFQVVEIHRVTNPQHPYPVCPHCFNHPPNPRLQEMACFSCAAPACALATGAQDQCVVQFCPCCRSHPMKLKRTKTAKFTVGCVDYPACTTSVWLPSAVKVAVVTTALCPACSNVHQMIYKLRLRFAPGALPPDVHQGTSNDDNGEVDGFYEACLFCDPLLQQLFAIRLPLSSSSRLPGTPAAAMPRPQIDQSYARMTAGRTSANNNNEYMQSITNPGKKRTRTPKPTNGASGRNDDDGRRSDVPMCPGHQTACATREVRKDNENKGRKFYCCSYPQGEQCEFFLWVDAADTYTAPASSSSSGAASRSKKKPKAGAASNQVTCTCGAPALELTSRTANNNGRVFYKCAKQTDNCNFFEWADPGMAGDFTTTTLIRVGVGLAVATTMISFRQMFIRSVFRVLRERLGRSSLLSDVERHFLTSISIALVLLACFVGVVIAGYHNEVSIVFQYAAGVPLVLATRATRIIFTKWLIRSLGWDISSRSDYSRVLVITEGLGIVAFFVISIELFMIYVPSTFNELLVIFFAVLEILCICSFYSTVKNAVMGFFLLFTEPFRLGSMVIIGASVGVVEQIALHSTKLRAQDGAVVHIPNGVLADDVQRNFSHCTFRRLNFLVHVDHATPLNEMLAVLPHLAETLAPCVIPLEMLLAQEASLRLQDETNDKAPSKAADGDASMSRSSSMHSLLGNLWQPPSKLHRHPSSSSSSTATTSSIADRRDPSTMSTDISEFMLDDHLLHAPSLSTVEATQTDPRLLQVTLGGIHRIWVSALVPGNSFMDVARAKSTVNLAIMRCLERHRVRLHHAPRRRIPRYD